MLSLIGICNIGSYRLEASPLSRLPNKQTRETRGDISQFVGICNIGSYRPTSPPSSLKTTLDPISSLLEIQGVRGPVFRPGFLATILRRQRKHFSIIGVRMMWLSSQTIGNLKSRTSSTCTRHTRQLLATAHSVSAVQCN